MGKIVLLWGKMVLHEMSKHMKTKGQNGPQYPAVGFGYSSCILVELG